jgi:curved DNA-binding protein CbpA
MSEPVDFERELQALHEGLDSLNYYDFLGLRPGCDYVALRDGFYDRAQAFHPDRFVASSNAALKRVAYAVYKRMTEAYNVLSDPELRLAYDEHRISGDNRLPEVARARRLSGEERQLNNTFARIYLRAGRAKLDRGEVVGAWIDCQLGLTMENAAPLFKLRDDIRAHPQAESSLEGEE